jgi:hypothetical protein
MKQGLSIGLIIGGLLQYIFPDFNGLFGKSVTTSIEHRELVGVIVFIGGLLLFYLPSNSNSD